MWNNYLPTWFYELLFSQACYMYIQKIPKLIMCFTLHEYIIITYNFHFFIALLSFMYHITYSIPDSAFSQIPMHCGQKCIQYCIQSMDSDNHSSDFLNVKYFHSFLDVSMEKVDLALLECNALNIYMLAFHYRFLKQYTLSM